MASSTVKDFQIIAKLGEGAYSSVYKVKRIADNNEYALKKVKLLNLSDKEKQNALNEVRILASVRHPNIVGYKEAFLDDVSNSLCIVMDFANNGDLFQRIVEHQKKGTMFNENEIWIIFMQIVKGLKALHDLKILHRDLKSANVFLNKDGTVKLGDMNVSKVAKKGLLYTQTGTPYYASPEVWKDQPYDSKSDIWSLGCVLYEITTLKPPFRAEDMEGLYKKVIRGYYPRIPTHYSQDLNNVIRALLQVAPHLRPGCDKILQLPAVIKRLEEKYFTEVDEGVPALMSTIRVPKNIHYLTERLPKPNYAPLKTKKVDKNKFLQTLAGYKDVEYQINHDSQNNPHNINVRNSAPDMKHHLPKISGNSSTEELDNNDDLSRIYDQISSATRAESGHPRSPSKKKQSKERPSRDPSLQSRNDESSLILSKHEKSSNYRDEVILKPNNNEKYEKHISSIQQIYGVKLQKSKKQVELSPSSKVSSSRAKKNLNLLELEGESKPLNYKQKKALHSSIDSIHEDDENKLPIISSNKARINDDDSSSKLPLIGKKDNIYAGENKHKDIYKLYKISQAGSIDDIKEKGIKPTGKKYRRNISSEKVVLAPTNYQND